MGGGPRGDGEIFSRSPRRLGDMAMILAAVVGFLAPRAQPRIRPSLRMSAVQGDNLLMAATAALQAGDAEGATALLAEAREEYGDDLTAERKQVLDMLQTRVGALNPVSKQRDDVKAVAARLAAKSGPVAWNPIASTPAAEKAMREGDAAVGRVVSALGQKEFVEAFEALEAARDAFMRAGPEVETARSQTIDNLYGYIRAETERNEKLARLVRMKEVLKKKADLKLQDELDERRAGGFES